MPVDAPAPHGGQRYSLLVDEAGAAAPWRVAAHRGHPAKAAGGKGASQLARTLPCEPWSRAAPTSAGARWPRAPGPRPAAAVPRRGAELPWFFAPPLLLLLLLVLVLLPAVLLLLAPLRPPAPPLPALWLPAFARFPRRRTRRFSPPS